MALNSSEECGILIKLQGALNYGDTSILLEARDTIRACATTEQQLSLLPVLSGEDIITFVGKILLGNEPDPALCFIQSLLAINVTDDVFEEETTVPEAHESVCWNKVGSLIRVPTILKGLRGILESVNAPESQVYAAVVCVRLLCEQGARSEIQKIIQSLADPLLRLIRDKMSSSLTGKLRSLSGSHGDAELYSKDLCLHTIREALVALQAVCEAGFAASLLRRGTVAILASLTSVTPLYVDLSLPVLSLFLMISSDEDIRNLEDHSFDKTTALGGRRALVDLLWWVENKVLVDRNFTRCRNAGKAARRVLIRVLEMDHDADDTSAPLEHSVQHNASSAPPQLSSVAMQLPGLCHDVREPVLPIRHCDNFAAIAAQPVLQASCGRSETEVGVRQDESATDMNSTADIANDLSRSTKRRCNSNAGPPPSRQRNENTSGIQLRPARENTGWDRSTLVVMALLSVFWLF